MNYNTALRAENGTAGIIFRSVEHENFFWTYILKCREQDVYHMALIYCLGIDKDTRTNINKIFDFNTGRIKPRCLNEGWRTSGSKKIIRLAFNLYNNGTPSVVSIKDTEERLAECRHYTVEDIFCCSYARYFWQAIKLRYPEYCNG